MDETQTRDRYTVFSPLKTWLLATVELADDICRISKQTSESSYCRDPLSVQRFDYKCTLFLVSLNKARRWAKHVQAVEPGAAGIANVFLVKTEEANSVRNKREHDDEYLIGGKSIPTNTIEHDLGVISIDLTSTLINDDKIFLGGKLCVQDARAAACQLQSFLEHIS